MVILSLVIFLACQKDGTDSNSEVDESLTSNQIYYTCSMHPHVHEDKPGKCPICHMNLTKVEIEDTNSENNEIEENKESVSKISEQWACKDFPTVTSEKEDICPLDGSKMVNIQNEVKANKVIAKVKLRKSQLKHFRPDVYPVGKKKLNKNIRLLGSVLQSEERESKVPARLGGRIEKVYVKSTGSFIKVGDPVVDIYSPKLITAGEEYILARKNYEKFKSSEFKDLLLQSIQRLKLWGVKSQQYQKWFKHNSVPRQITVFSSTTGIVRKKNVQLGKYIKEGQSFFELSDLSDVWIEMDVYESDSSLIELGQILILKFNALPGEKFSGKVDFVSPVLNPTSRTLKIRTTIDNNFGKLKPGMIANAELNVDIAKMSLVVPRTAIIDTGKRKVVWVKKSKNMFEARLIHSGHESLGYVQIKMGLKEGEEVVIEGNFLLDAQAQLFGGYE